jgi:hypothetical protein
VDIDNSTDISIDDIDNRKVIYTEDEGLSKGAWPPPDKIYLWDSSSSLVQIYDDLATAYGDAASGDTLVLGAGTHTLSSKLTISIEISIVGHYREGAIILGAFADDLIEITTNGTVSFKDVKLENSHTGNVVSASCESTGTLIGIFDRCYLSAISSGGTADGLIIDSSSGNNIIRLNQCIIESTPFTTGHCIDITDATSSAVA